MAYPPRPNLKASLKAAGADNLLTVFKELKSQYRINRMISTPVATKQKLSFFMDFKVQGPFRQIMDSFADWILGKGSYNTLREDRLADGIPPDWTIPRITGQEGDGVFNGEGQMGLELQIRIDDPNGDAFFRMVTLSKGERGNKQPLNLIEINDPDGTLKLLNRPIGWLTLVSIKRESDSQTRIRHAIITEQPIGYKTPWKGGCPQILQDLIKQYPNENSLISMKPTLIDAESSGDFALKVLLDPGRILPVLVISLQALKRFDSASTGDHLQRQLFGLAQVAVLEPCEKFDQVITHQGPGIAFTVPNGGARLYLPAFGPGSNREDHRLWTMRELEKDRDGGAQRLIQESGEIISDLMMPSGFVNQIQTMDRKRKLTHAEAVTAKPTLETDEEHQVIIELKSELEMAMGEVQQLEEKNQLLERENRRLESMEEQLGTQLMKLSGAKARSKDLPAENLILDPISERCLLGRPNSPEDALTFITAAFPNRLFALPSAFLSAKEAATFLYPERVLEKLIVLGTSYWTSLAEGLGGDAHASEVFGDSYAAKENKSLSTRGRRLRTFQYDGRAIFMDAHLRIGVKDSPNACWRCHFHWDHEHQVIVIGHCGKHLDP